MTDEDVELSKKVDNVLSSIESLMVYVGNVGDKTTYNILKRKFQYYIKFLDFVINKDD